MVQFLNQIMHRYIFLKFTETQTISTTAKVVVYK